MSIPDLPLLPQDAIANCDAAYLRALREEKGVDIVVLARNACLSVGQIRELESGKDGRYFYSDTIKRQAYKRVLTVLGVVPSQNDALAKFSIATSSDGAQLRTLDLLVDMNHRPVLKRPIVSYFRNALAQLEQYKQTVGAFLMLVLALGGLAIYGTQRDSKDQFNVKSQDAVSPIPSPSSANSVVPIVDDPEAKVHVIAKSTDQTQLLAAETTQETVAEAKCSFSAEAMPQIAPIQAYKEGRYVHLISSTDTQVCVVDSQKQGTLLHMKAGDSKSVYGIAPWQISSLHLQQIKIYFQGALVVLPSGNPKRLLLSETTITH